MARQLKHSSGFYLNVSAWIIAAGLLAVSVRSLAFADVHAGMAHDAYQALPANLADRPATPSASSVRLYDVHDIVDQWELSQRVPPSRSKDLALNSTSNNQQQNPPGQIDLFGSSVAEKPDAMYAIVELIIDTTHSEDWTVRGGSNAAISSAGRTLIVAGDSSLQRDVARLLRSLREADANAPPIVNR